MRISIERGDPGYNLGVYVRAIIFFNGVEFKRAITADEEKGYVKAYFLDEKGNCRLSHGGVHYSIEELYGKVKIVL